MKGDFTRRSFDPHRHYTQVLMQQGRVQLDADWNEQVAIAEHHRRQLAADVIGPTGGPEGHCGFAVVTDPAVVETMTGKYGLPLEPERLDDLRQRLDKGDFVIGTGRYYVDGLMCENDFPITFAEQLGYPFDEDSSLDQLRDTKQFLIYLDVWQRHVSGTEVPELVEVALGGPDTTSRAQLVWQVKVLQGDKPQTCVGTDDLVRARLPLLRARAKQPQDQPDACVIDPESRYRGAENQLYRVEIHRGGVARVAGEKSGGATFKWSRENGSVIVPVVDIADDTAAAESTMTVATLGRDRRLGLNHEDWVEVVDDRYALRGSVQPLLSVDRIEPDDLTIVLDGLADPVTGRDSTLHPVLRRWDHDASDRKISEDGALLVLEAGSADEGWIELEDGVWIQFPVSSDDANPNDYRSGDYWLVPARTAAGDVIWPRHLVGEELTWEALPPDGVEHHYAPLAVASIAKNGDLSVESPGCRLEFAPLPNHVL